MQDKSHTIVQILIIKCDRCLERKWIGGIVWRSGYFEWYWSKHLLLLMFFGIMDVFKDLLQTMCPLSRNMHIYFRFRKFTHFQKLLCEFQSKKSYLRDSCDWNWLSERERVSTARERLGMSSVCRMVESRGFSPGRVISLTPVPLHALNSQKSKWIIRDGILPCLYASWICLQC